MSWLYSQVLVEEYLVDTFLDGEQSAPLNGNPIQQAYCAPDKMTVFSRLSRFGMTYKPLTESRGEELLTSYLADFHAKTSAQQEKAQEFMESEAECGEKWHASFTKYDPDLSLWKTHQCSLLGDLDEFSETWPQWGLMRDGECWEQRTLEQTIRGTEYGLSPNGMDSFHTLNTTGLDGGSNSRKELKKKQETWSTPTEYVQKFPTPQASDWKNKNHSRDYTLGNVKYIWPTPTAHMAKETNAPSEHKRNTPTLTAQVNWTTPRTKDMFGGSGAWAQLKAKTTIEEARSMGAGNGGKLNPNWVEWLMNWPIKWSDLNGFNKKEFQRWQEASATAIQSAGALRTMWWDSDPSQTPLGQQHIKQSEKQHSNSLSEMSRSITRKSEMEGSFQGSDLSVLRDDIHIQKTKGENLQSGMWEQTCMDETQIVPRVDNDVIARVDRLKAIGNGQVPLCAATAWRILSA
jgi:DNA (cytosine-5)-methyltransferase 1